MPVDQTGCRMNSLFLALRAYAPPGQRHRANRQEKPLTGNCFGPYGAAGASFVALFQ